MGKYNFSHSDICKNLTFRRQFIECSVLVIALMNEMN